MSDKQTNKQSYNEQYTYTCAVGGMCEVESLCWIYKLTVFLMRKTGLVKGAVS